MSVLGCVITALVVRLSIAYAAMGPRLGGSSDLGASLVDLSLGLGWIRDAVARRLRFYIGVKPSPSALCAVLTPLSCVSSRVAGLVCGELRFPAISNWRGR
jgi:hypothetical protein